MERAAGTWLARQAARELGIEESSGGPQSLEPMVDELMGGLPGRAKELKVVRPLRSPDAARATARLRITTGESVRATKWS